MSMGTHKIQVAVCSAVAALAMGCSLLGAREIVFKDAERQSRQFIEWHRTIQLAPEQEGVKKAALEPLPAPCCSDKSAYTCCCQCNISRTMWGLAHYMIAEQDAGAEKVREKVQEWVRFISPNGHSGKTCYVGGCARPFRQDGCGGMDAAHVVF